MTMKLHKEVDHKNYEMSTNCTSFFNRRNQPIGEKMFPIVRSTSITRFLHTTNSDTGLKQFSVGILLILEQLYKTFTQKNKTSQIVNFNIL